MRLKNLIPEISIAKSIAIAWWAILNKVLRHNYSNITLKKYCNTESDTEKSISDTSNSDIVLQY